MAKTVERTAIEPFVHDGQSIAKGQVVTLTAAQVRKLASSGCVALTDEDDAEVPKRELPQTKGSLETETSRLAAEAQAKAAADKAAADADAKAAADKAAADARLKAASGQS